MKKYSIVLLLLWLIGLIASCSNTLTFNQKGSKVYGSETCDVVEITFRSERFKIVGDLRFPHDDSLYPAVILVHGSGDATREGAVNFEPLIEIFLRNGYAVFSWDKPGSGASTGEFESGQTLYQRGQILADGIDALSEHPRIDSSKLGVWGVSQAGWVIPHALELNGKIGFMIIVGGGGEDSIEQMAYQVGQKVICDGGTKEQAEIVEQHWSQWTKATDYDSYKEALETILDIPGVQEYTGLTITAEDNWSPWPQDIDAFMNPMDVITHTTIPVLALFGEFDKNVDPIQGAEAYKLALENAGNQHYRVEIIEGAGHVLTTTKTGCIGESGGKDYIPEYLNILEEWVQGLN
ncbi:MAG TPA: alpha/beta hydrolase [Dehalococcoidia bacterium]|nr:alpha/beta hydrolase [Dehalococcoidia bacterium]